MKYHDNFIANPTQEDQEEKWDKKKRGKSWFLTWILCQGEESFFIPLFSLELYGTFDSSWWCFDKASFFFI